MRGLFVKIFLFFWVAQSLTFIISTTLILQHRFARPDQVFDALSITMKNEGLAAAQAYERGGCDAFREYAASISQTIYLADALDHFPCEISHMQEYGSALAKIDRNSRVSSTHIGTQYLWVTTVLSPSGKHYQFLLATPYRTDNGRWTHDLWHFAFPQLPVAIVVFGATTFILVLLLTRPIARIRAAARNLARGQLNTRISSSSREVRIFGGDEIQELVHDFNHMAEQLESLVAAQKMLLRDVSHELRSPLARLSVALELAREDAPTLMLPNLERIEREAARLNALIGQLLRLSSIESAHATIDTEEFKLSHLLEDLLPDIEFEALQRSCTVKMELTCDCLMRGNPELIYRAIENIARNAIRFTEDASSVDIVLGCKQQEDQWSCLLQISDRGPGLPENELLNIFRPFYRVDSARQRDTGGFGIGLAIADRAIRLHQGSLRAINRTGGGMTMIVTLPCRTPCLAQEAI